MRILYTTCLILSFIFFQCKSEKKKSPIEAEPEKLEKLNIPSPASAQVDESFKALAEKNAPNPDLEDGIWHFQVGLSIKEEAPKNNIFEGQWLDLLPGGQFKKGLFSDTTESGYYTFDAKSKIIQLRAMNTKSSSEWKVMVDPDHMVWVGTPTYGNNSWQIKLRRESGLPEKK